MYSIWRTIPITTVFFVILVLLDLYYLKSWGRYIRQMGWSEKIIKTTKIISLIMAPATILAVWLKFFILVPNEFIKIMMILPLLWYFPKVLIVPCLMIVDLVKKIIGKSRKADKIQRAETSSASDSRRKFIASTGWLLSALPYGLVANGFLRTTNDFKIYETAIPIPNLSKELENFKIIQLSDIHAGSFFSEKPFLNARMMIDAIKPDMIVITGDFVNSNPSEMDFIMPQFSALKAEYGVYAVLGNHDHYMNTDYHKMLINKIRSCGIDLLINENRTINVKGSQLQLAGSDNKSWKHNFANFDKTFSGLSESLPTILLCHDPSNWESAILPRFKADLTLSGHTHGGQVGFEVFNTEISPVRIIYNQWAGLYKHKDMYLYVNRGLGVVGPPIRIGIQPEITLLTLQKAEYLT